MTSSVLFVTTKVTVPLSKASDVNMELVMVTYLDKIPRNLNDTDHNQIIYVAYLDKSYLVI